MIWNSKATTYYDKGRRAYTKGDTIPDKVLDQMGKKTRDEYIKHGLISDPKKTESAGEEASELKRKALFLKAEKLGLKPHYKAGIQKLEAMLEEYEALQELKKEALELGIDPSDDVTLEELTLFVNEKKASPPFDGVI